MAPAREGLRPPWASAGGTKSRSTFDPAVVRLPRVEIVSLSEMGIPRRGLREPLDPWRRINSFSARRAAASAWSAVTVKNALSFGLYFAIRRRNCSVSSTGEILRFTSSALSSSMVANERESSLVIVSRLTPDTFDWIHTSLGAFIAKTELFFRRASSRRRVKASAMATAVEPALKHFFLLPQIAKVSKVSNDTLTAELVLREHLSECQAPVLKG